MPSFIFVIKLLNFTPFVFCRFFSVSLPRFTQLLFIAICSGLTRSAFAGTTIRFMVLVYFFRCFVCRFSACLSPLWKSVGCINVWLWLLVLIPPSFPIFWQLCALYFCYMTINALCVPKCPQILISAGTCPSNGRTCSPNPNPNRNSNPIHP